MIGNDLVTQAVHQSEANKHSTGDDEEYGKDSEPTVGHSDKDGGRGLGYAGVWEG